MATDLKEVPREELFLELRRRDTVRRLQELSLDTESDEHDIIEEAENLLLEHINDPEITKAYRAITQI
jgi:hypothetical protein